MSVIAKYTHGPIGADIKKVQDGLEKGMRAAARDWQEKIAPGHFRPGAAKKYKYARRSIGHVRRKRRKFGHNKPLVYTGDTLRWVKGRLAKPQIIKKGGLLIARQRVKTPDYFYKYHLDRPGPDKVGELITTIAPEIDRQTKIITDHIDAELRKKSGARRKKIS